MKDEECPEPIMHKFLALVKVESIQEPIRHEEYAPSLEEFKAIITKEHKSVKWDCFAEFGCGSCCSE
jgi:hypothetical protein